ncbi:MAG: threonine synthase [Desulfobacterales bacterium SG8_35_2]|nr:MAG: threonine synthase [Desulfobacterales bacterium SG8_35_2]
MHYISTRGGISPISFKDAVMMGLATDGGLLLPEVLPEVDPGTLNRWQSYSFQQLASEIYRLFITDIPVDQLDKLISRSYASFSHPEITPLVKKGDIFIMELFHGPTLAFKDVALQFLGNVFAYILQETGSKMNIIGATSGDTGSAAIYGVRGKERINIFILHPYKRVSPIQELQMTTVIDPNVFNLAIKGTFDDGQAIVKAIFNDIPFKNKYHLGAVNSINWARILAQVVYYVYAWFKVTAETGVDSIDFSVPTGNFGDIFAGYIARNILPPGAIRKLILATNENNLLTRFVTRGDYSISKVVATSSPSMDIQVASNFERYLYYLYDCDAVRTRKDFERFSQTGKLRFDDNLLRTIQQDFASKSVTEAETLDTIRTFYQENDYLLDPHTAVGVNAAQACTSADVPVVCLATAHPAKFGAAVTKAIGRPPELPPELQMSEQCRIILRAMHFYNGFISQGLGFVL